MIKINRDGTPNKELTKLLKDSFKKRSYVESLKFRDEELHDLFLSEDFKYYRGKSRDVYVKGKFVLKLARNRSGYSSNEDEIKYYKRSSKKRLLAKIYSYNSKNRWVIMERVDIPNNEKRIKYAEKLKKMITDDMMKCGFDVDDIHKDNVGEKNGKPILLDYGGGLLIHPRTYRIKK